MNEKVFCFALTLWLFSFPCALCARKEKGNHFVTAAPQRRAIDSTCKVGDTRNTMTGEAYYKAELFFTYQDGSQDTRTIYRGDFSNEKELRNVRRKALMSCADYYDKSGGS